MLSVLVVEDDPVFAQAMKAVLASWWGDALALRWADDLEVALSELKRDPPDALVLDLTLPDSAGLDTLRAAKEACRSCAIVVLTGTDDEATGPQALREGAHEFLVKGDFGLPVLPRAIRHAVERKRLEKGSRA